MVSRDCHGPDLRLRCKVRGMGPLVLQSVHEYLVGGGALEEGCFQCIEEVWVPREGCHQGIDHCEGDQLNDSLVL